MKWFWHKLYRLFFWRTSAGEFLTLIYSFYLHLRFSFVDRDPGSDKGRLQFYLAKHCHIIEKGMALPEPRLGFGEEKIRKIIMLTNRYLDLYGESDLTLSIQQMVQSYLDFHGDRGAVLEAGYRSVLEEFITGAERGMAGGIRTIKRDELARIDLEQFERFAASRYSIRDFSSVPVPEEKLLQIVEAARNTPSVCNRQGWSFHYYRNPNDIKEILSYQNGNTGFTDVIDKLIVVTGNIKAFTRYEHNQLFIDGGLFSMNLMLAIHAAGLGCCPLNTCFPHYVEGRVKRRAGISKNEKLIMMLAVGSLKDEFRVACSQKYKVQDIVVCH